MTHEHDDELHFAVTDLESASRMIGDLAKSATLDMMTNGLGPIVGMGSMFVTGMVAAVHNPEWASAILSLLDTATLPGPDGDDRQYTHKEAADHLAQKHPVYTALPRQNDGS
jgi:hypothetical protein